MKQPSITRIPTTRPDLYAFEVNGRITKPDIEGMAQMLKSAFAAHGEVDIIIVMAKWDGIDLGAMLDRKAMTAQVAANSHVRKYAVVGAPGWAEAMINIFSPLTPVEERTFSLEQEREAWAWIAGDRSFEDARKRATERS